MVTLSGSHTSPSVNYYNADDISVDLSTAGFAPGSTFTFTVQATSTTCTDQIDWEVFLQRPLPSTESCFHWQAITPSGAPTTALTYGPSHVGDGVEWTGTAGATGCTDFTRVVFYLKPYMYPGTCSITWNWSITYTPTGGTVGYCAYGTETKPGVTEIVMISAPLLASIGIFSGNLWLIALAAGILGGAISTNELCSRAKPTDVTLAPADWTTPDPSGIGTVAQHKAAANIYNVLWDTFCECRPAPSGSPAPVSPPVTVITKPTYLTHIDTINIDNTEISTTINQLWQYFLTFNVGNNNNTTIGSAIQTCTCTDYKLGTAHEGLTGEGSFAVSGIHGLSVTFTTLPPRTGVDLGDPDRIYDVGWINVGNTWGWQPPLFPNTSKWLVFPPDMHQMTEVGYSFPLDVVATIAELVTA